jgi:hypothetical protein
MASILPKRHAFTLIFENHSLSFPPKPLIIRGGCHTNCKIRLPLSSSQYFHNTETLTLTIIASVLFFTSNSSLQLIRNAFSLNFLIPRWR